MKEFINKPIDINRLEFWAATTMYVFAVFLLVSMPDIGPNSNHFDDRGMEYSYFSNYFVPKLIRYTIFYMLYLLLVYRVIPSLLRKTNLATNIILILFVFAILVVAFGITETWLKGYLLDDRTARTAQYEAMFKSSFVYSFWLMMVFAFYVVLKFLAQYLLENEVSPRYNNKQVNRDSINVFILWLISFFLLLVSDINPEFKGLYGFIIPSAIALYWYSSYNLIPRARLRKNDFRYYLLQVVLILTFSVLPLSIIIYALMSRNEAMLIVNMFNIGFQLLITAPLSWYIYKQRLADNQELTTLKTALGNSSANLDFLRSQINPHFLFNALNTLYGTALQENADRTGEGIQKLGDMMRFMLEENMQEKITLNREIDYINNYIGLQRLRTQSSPDINITTHIENHINTLSITPMLLIPFIENAFKHGISLREPSHIKITLQVRENGLYFDVYNSIHIKPDNDPEKNKSGIGLNNVRQRLKLLYPSRHELIIRENASEFFVHLTMQL